MDDEVSKEFEKLMQLQAAFDRLAALRGMMHLDTMRVPVMAEVQPQPQSSAGNVKSNSCKAG